MVNYQNAKIYMIESKIGNIKYYGSTTTTLHKRLQEHICDIKRSLYVSSKEVLKHPDFEITEILKYPCNSKIELLFKEQEFIINNVCCNKNLPIDPNEKQRN